MYAEAIARLVAIPAGILSVSRVVIRTDRTQADNIPKSAVDSTVLMILDVESDPEVSIRSTQNASVP